MVQDDEAVRRGWGLRDSLAQLLGWPDVPRCPKSVWWWRWNSIVFFLYHKIILRHQSNNNHDYYLKVLNDGRFFGPFLSSNFALFSFVFFIYLKVLNDEVDHLATAHLELLAVHLWNQSELQRVNLGNLLIRWKVVQIGKTQASLPKLRLWKVQSPICFMSSPTAMLPESAAVGDSLIEHQGQQLFLWPKVHE